VNGIIEALGTFATKNEAGRAYDSRAREVGGHSLNFPDENPTAAPPEEARDGSGEPFTLSATKDRDRAVVRVVVLGNLPRDRVERMPVAELRAELAKRSLSVDGPEADLRARLLGESPWLSTCV